MTNQTRVRFTCPDWKLEAILSPKRAVDLLLSAYKSGYEAWIAQLDGTLIAIS